VRRENRSRFVISGDLFGAEWSGVDWTASLDRQALVLFRNGPNYKVIWTQIHSTPVQNDHCESEMLRDANRC
jgi:hypothetical protein